MLRLTRKQSWSIARQNGIYSNLKTMRFIGKYEAFRKASLTIRRSTIMYIPFCPNAWLFN